VGNDIVSYWSRFDTEEGCCGSRMRAYSSPLFAPVNISIRQVDFASYHLITLREIRSTLAQAFAILVRIRTCLNREWYMMCLDLEESSRSGGSGSHLGEEEWSGVVGTVLGCAALPPGSALRQQKCLARIFRSRLNSTPRRARQSATVTRFARVALHASCWTRGLITLLKQPSLQVPADGRAPTNCQAR
jgi:hypothetical protein